MGVPISVTGRRAETKILKTNRPAAITIIIFHYITFQQGKTNWTMKIQLWLIQNQGYTQGARVF